MTRRPFNTSRKGNKRKTNKAVLLVTNGKRTESAYLTALSKKANEQPNLRVKHTFLNGEPKSVLKKLQSPYGDTSGYDEIWIVVDSDGNDRKQFILDCSKLTSTSQGWFPVVSIPCFEVWLIAHYEKVKNYTKQEDAQAHYRKLIPRATPEKNLPGNFPFDEMATAASRCQLSGTTATDIYELPPSPGSAMPHLIRGLNVK